ncbi:flavin reductase family protein [Neopusillimonas aromaticivorans]|uniref:flavin reductase family protein n=1 Tax=Neopusillimonas aromaticivorans TaxID=2979868 RepID=UPI002598B235|nr:flavin reductase family protein [Neopusillimonas aromaticivorans]WJJ94902.1 flavin reductase family protein [Neopusillimonas aromaticivorans]
MMTTQTCPSAVVPGMPMQPSQGDFRSVMARLPAAVNIITSDGPGGKVGMTATAMCSLTDSPPSVLVCLHEASRTTRAILQNGQLAVNMLAAGSEALSAAFAGQQGLEMAQRFGLSDASWITLVTGSPVLENSIGSFDCTVSEHHKVGTHFILCCAVEALHVGPEKESLMYHQRQYRHL